MCVVVVVRGCFGVFVEVCVASKPSGRWELSLYYGVGVVVLWLGGVKVGMEWVWLIGALGRGGV